MDTEYKIYVDQKFDHMEEKIDKVVVSVARIETKLNTEEEMEESQDNKSDSKWSKVGIFIGSIAAVIATIAVFG